MSRGPASQRLSRWFVDLVSRLLESDERQVVLGDLAESDASSGRALCDVLGLVIRRQAAVWMDRRPWVALAGVVVPLGMILSLVSRFWADGSAIHWWFYVNNWTWGYLESPGARSDLAHFSAGVLLNYLTLICWSWTTGFVLGSLSRRAIGITGLLFCLVLFGGTLGRTSGGRANLANAAVFSLTFYGVLFPSILRTVLVVIPALAGMRNGCRLGMLPLRSTVVWAVVVTILTVLTARGLEGSLIFGWRSPWHLPRLIYPGLDGFIGTADDLIDWRVRLLPLAVMWPVAYMLASASWRRWADHTGSP